VVITDHHPAPDAALDDHTQQIAPSQRAADRAAGVDLGIKPEAATP
jgi:single-stranded DNA-specific DHH superfamily exonuclease